MRVPVSPYPHQHLVLLLFWVLTTILVFRDISLLFSFAILKWHMMLNIFSMPFYHLFILSVRCLFSTFPPKWWFLIYKTHMTITRESLEERIKLLIIIFTHTPVVIFVLVSCQHSLLFFKCTRILHNYYYVHVILCAIFV